MNRHIYDVMKNKEINQTKKIIIKSPLKEVKLSDYRLDPMEEIIDPQFYISEEQK